MNYCELEELDINNLINNIEINKNSAKSFLNDYEILKKNLTDYKNNLNNLINQKNIYDNYLNNLFNNHLNIINIINNDNKLNNSFNDYQSNIKEKYNIWIKEYEIKIKTIQDNIENIEIKLKDFTNLFIYIINNLIANKEISKNMCPICFENEIDICQSPCGHTICNKCVLSNRTNIYNNKW